MIKIAIIDEGVDAGHPRLLNSKVIGYTIKESDGNLYSVDADHHIDATGHGTAIASIIHKIVPEAELHSVRLFAEGGKISEQLLTEGIKHCLSIDGLKVVNISMGIAVSTPSSTLFDSCRILAETGVIIVASSHNFPHLECFPAHFPFVYSVGCGLVKNKNEYRYDENKKTKILAKGGLQRIAWADKGYKISSGTSYATAHFAGILSRLIIDNAPQNEQQVKELISSNSSNDVTEFIYISKNYDIISSGVRQLNKAEQDILGKKLFTPHKIDFAEKVAVFPSSEKEIKTIIEFKDQIRGELVLSIDYPRSISSATGKAGTVSSDFLSINKEPGKQELDLFDTIVIGYFLDIPVESNILFGNRVLKNCILSNKNFIVFDNDVFDHLNRLIEEIYPQYAGNIHFTSVRKKVVDEIKNFRHLPKIQTSVLACVGTGSKQGKFTSQMRIKEILSAQGYNVSQLSTEPQGVVVGSAFTFPFGHNANVEIKFRDWTSNIETILRGIQHYNNPDLIITGIQGGILPRAFNMDTSKAGAILTPIQYLLGVRPDAVICTIHPTDTVELVQQTIQTVRNYCNSTCLFCTMSPVYNELKNINNVLVKTSRLLHKNEMITIMDAFSDKLGLPVFDIMDMKNDEKILRCITNFFS
jgi:uncharacterized NAD-dependent epimerase/dehydratase family protein